MAGSIIRIKKIYKSELSQTGRHNFRCFSGGGIAVEEEELLQDFNNFQVPERYQYERKHIDFSRTKTNKYYLISEENKVHQLTKRSDYQDLEKYLEEREEKRNIKGIRKNSIRALEVVMTMGNCKEVLQKTGISDTQFVGLCLRFLQTYYTKDRDKSLVVAATLHKDESNWHVHVIIQPTITQEFVKKNRFGSSKKTETHLDIRTLLGKRRGDKEPFRKLQTAWNELLKRTFNSRLDDDDLKIRDIVRSEDQTRQYSEHTNYIFAEVDRKIKELNERIEEFMINNKEKLAPILKEMVDQRDVLIASKKNNKEKSASAAQHEKSREGIKKRYSPRRGL